MGEAYRGLTVQFKADGSKVLSELRAMSRAASKTETELRMMKRALRFDGSSTRAAQAQMKLLGERAAAVSAEAKMMRRQFQELGDVKVGSTEMRRLSAATKDASSQAAILEDRYANATKELATQYRALRKIASSEKEIAWLADIFKGKDFLGRDIGEINAAIELMGEHLKWSTEKINTQKAAVKGLRSEFKAAANASERMSKIAQYQSFGNKIVEQTAKAKAAIREMNAAAKAFQPTAMSAKLTETRADMMRLEEQAKQLKQAMRLDPGSMALASAHSEALRTRLIALKAEAEDLKAEIRDLGDTPGVVEAAADAQKLESNLRQARAELERIGDEATEARAKLDVMSKEANDLRAQFLKAATAEERMTKSGELIRAESALKSQRAEVKATGEAYERAAQQVQLYNRAAQLNQSSAALAANGATQAALAAQIKQGKKTRFFSSSAFTAMGMQTYSTLYPMVMMGGHYAVEAADAVDSAYRDMRKTVQGTEEDFVALKKAAVEFGNTHYTSADQMLSIEAIGGQLGVTVDNLEAFGKVVSDLSIATDDAFETEDIALWLGKMANIMHINSEEYDNFADSLVRLGNSEPALESDIANITSRFAGMASIVGMTPDQILAIATAATATGQKAESAGGSLMRTLGRIESATAGVTEGMRNLDDMTEEDIEEFEAAKDSLEGYAKITHMTADEFAKSWEQDPTHTFQKFVNGLKEIKEEGGSVENTLHEVLGIGSIRDRQLLSGLTQTTDVLAESLQMSFNAYNGISDAFGAAGDAAREAENKSMGFSGTLQIMKNNAQNLAATMAESLTPELKWLTGVLQGLVGWYGQLDPGIQTGITNGLLGLALTGPMMTGIGAFGNMAGSFKSSFKEYMSAENKMARIESNSLSNAVGLTRAYKEKGDALNKVKGELNAARALEREVNSQQAIHIAQTGEENKKLKEQQREATKMRKAEERNLLKQRVKGGALSFGAGALNLAKGIGTMGIYGAAAVGIEQLVTHLYDAWQKNEQFRQSTQGVRDVVDRLKNSTDAANLGVGNYAEKVALGTKSTNELHESAQTLIANNAELASGFNKTLDGAEENAIMAQFYADKIFELSENIGGDKTKLEELQYAIREYNNLTGDSATVIDDFTGRLNLSTEAIRANLEAYKERAMANAFIEVAEKSSEAVAEGTVEMEIQDRKLKELIETRNKLEDAHKGETGILGADESGVQYEGWKIQLDQIQAQIDTILQDKSKIEESTAAAQEAADTAWEMAAGSKAAAEAKQKESDAMRDSAAAVETYSSKMKEGEWDTMLEAIGKSDDMATEFAAALNGLGISAENLALVGGDAFAQLYESADGDLLLIRDAFNALNDYNIEPKDITITDNGIEVKEHIVDLENQTIDGKKFTVDDDGTIRTLDGEATNLQLKLDTLGKTNPSPTVSVKDNATGVLDSIINKINNQIRDKTVTITTNHKNTYSSATVSGQGTTTLGHAAGGVSIPLNASGGVSIPLNAGGGFGIARSATLTPDGIIGEAGTEAYLQMGRQRAIVPLSNRRYVRPFARAVAAEMGGTQRAQRSVSVTVNLDYTAGSDATSMARDLASELGAILELEG